MSEKNLAAFPLARIDDLVTETIGSETVVYDGTTKDAHCLTPLAAVVFAAADGRSSVADIAGIATAKLEETVTVADVELALAELEDRDLLTATGNGVSRRDLLRRGALVGGAALAAPLIVSLATPDYGQAGSLSSLSYVVLIFKGSDGKYYRAKWQAGSAICGWGFATPGTDCFLDKNPKSEDCITGLNVVEATNGGGDTTITVSWTDTTKKLYDVRIKCANDCHLAVTGGNLSSPAGPYVGCP